jgi:hypothetical protein
MTKIHQGLPENAKLAFKGERFEVWQWEQTMYDGSTKKYLFLRIHKNW